MRKITNVVLIVLFFDFVCFILWAMSGQLPQDGFYFGVITKSFISLFI